MAARDNMAWSELNRILSECWLLVRDYADIRPSVATRTALSLSHAAEITLPAASIPLMNCPVINRQEFWRL